MNYSKLSVYFALSLLIITSSPLLGGWRDWLPGSSTKSTITEVPVTPVIPVVVPTPPVIPSDSHTRLQLLMKKASTVPVWMKQHKLATAGITMGTLAAIWVIYCYYQELQAQKDYECSAAYRYNGPR